MEPAYSVPRPAYRIETPRIELRCYEFADAMELAQVISDSQAHLSPWLSWAGAAPGGPPEKVELIRGWRAAFDRGEDFTYGVFERATGTFLGGAGLHRPTWPGVFEIGYWTRADRTREGIASEAATALVRTAFSGLDAHRLEIRVEPSNLGSRRIPERLGFQLDGVCRRSIEPSHGGDGNQWRDAEVWTLLSEEYPRSPAAECEVRAIDALGTPLRGLSS